MKKYSLLLLLLNIFSLHPMERQLTRNDLIKGKVSSEYCSQAIAVYQRILLLNTEQIKREQTALDKNKALKDIYSYDIKAIKGSIDLMQCMPCCTYGILQIGSNIWQQLETLKQQGACDFINEESKIYHETAKQEHKKLHEFYLAASQKAFQQISTDYAQRTKNALIQLWWHTLTVFTKDLFSDKAKVKAEKQLATTASMIHTIDDSALNTYNVLYCIHEMKEIISDNSFNEDKDIKTKKPEEIEYIKGNITLLKELMHFYDEVTLPGLFK